MRTRLGLETAICYNAFNMVGSVTDANGIATEYTYSPAGLVTRIVRRDGADKYTYDYHVDGQLATATYGSTTEDFLWDGLALVKRGKRGFVNEPHIGGGNPVMSSDGTTYFNDMLGTTLSSSADGETTSSSLTAFGATSQLTTPNSQLPTPNSDSFFTGKPFVPGLGHAFLFRNYRSDLGKWQTADPLGYPDGWNQLAYCRNGVTELVDLWGGKKVETKIVNFDTEQQIWVVIPWFNSQWDGFGQLQSLAQEAKKKGQKLSEYVNKKLNDWKNKKAEFYI